MPLGSRNYRLRLPKEVRGKAQNLSNLWGEDLRLSADMVRVEKSSDSKKLNVHFRLPEESEATTDWNWYHFSTKPSEKVQSLLKEGRVKLENPRFKKEKSGKKKDYYLIFKLLHPEEVSETEGPIERFEEKTREGWGRAAKVSTVILVFVFIAAVIYVVPGLPFRVVASSSMEPALNQGDVIYLTQPQNIEKGDIISFRVPQGYQERYGYPEHIVHRVVGRDGEYLETKGDDTGEDPFKTRISNVTGVYGGFKIPLIGHLFLFFGTLWGRIYAGILITTLILYITPLA